MLASRWDNHCLPTARHTLGVGSLDLETKELRLGAGFGGVSAGGPGGDGRTGWSQPLSGQRFLDEMRAVGTTHKELKQVYEKNNGEAEA